MISPETLRRYPTFGGLPDTTLRAIAMVGQEKPFKAGVRLFDESGRLQPGERFFQAEESADALMVVTQGEIDLMTVLSSGKQVFLGTAVAGDLLGVSSMIEPREFLLTAIARSDGALIAIDAARLRELCEEDTRLGYQLMRQVARDLRARLAQAVAQLAGMS
jgi:CRP-like cAMP-binding protein